MSDEKNEHIKVSSRIVCSKCGRTEYVPFHADGRRNYLCNSCMTSFNRKQKLDKVKKKERYGKTYYEFICYLCGEYIRETVAPLKIDGKPICGSCHKKRRREEKLRNKKGRIILRK